MNRKEITTLAQSDVLLVAGGKSPYSQGVQNIYSKLDKSRTSLLKIDGVANVLLEAPEKLAQSLLLFVKVSSCLLLELFVFYKFMSHNMIYEPGFASDQICLL